MTDVPDHFWDFMEDGDFGKFAAKETVAHGWCPACQNIAVFYPDGRLTCLRCEWEEPRSLDAGQGES